MSPVSLSCVSNRGVYLKHYLLAIATINSYVSDVTIERENA